MLLRKYKSLYSSTANSFNTGTGVTITPASVTGLPTDTEITLTFDRISSSGVAQATLTERICGQISGLNFAIRTSPSSGRGFDSSTEQTHTSPVVEMIWNAADWNDLITWALTEHTQAGLHNIPTSSLVSQYAADTGTANAIAVTLSPAPSGLVAGMVVVFKAANAVTGAATINVNSLGAIAIKKLDGVTALSANDIKAGQIVRVIYDGTNFQMTSPSGIALNTTDTQTLTNKRITKRALALSAGSATPAINTDLYDNVHITAQTAAITSFTTNLTGTPVEGDRLKIDITDDGTARAITWGTSFEASAIALPTTTVLSQRLDVEFVWNTVTSKWRCILATSTSSSGVGFATSGQQGAFTTTAATPTDVTGATVTINPTGAVTAQAIITGYFTLATGATGPTVSLVIDGTTVQTVSINPNVSANSWPFAVSGQKAVASGARVIKLQVTSDGNGAHGVTITNANVNVMYG